MSIRMLGVMLCYNDADVLSEALDTMLAQGHDVIAWDHGSTDSTPDILASYRSSLVESRRLSREFDFYKLYPAMSQHLMAHYVHRYDWISWPDQDEFLEGPDRSRSYREWVEIVCRSGFDWVQFVNCNFWLTSADDPAEVKTVNRVRHYAPRLDCVARNRAWRASATNERHFNHNPPLGRRWPFLFKLRHYPMRTLTQLNRRINIDRAGIRKGHNNYHYENMARWPSRLNIEPRQLYFDDGKAELSVTPIFDWRTIYGSSSNVDAKSPEDNA
jgi:glycosyltransferase involved in cell wall biosynthesis